MTQVYPNLGDLFEGWESWPVARHQSDPGGTIIYISEDIHRYNYHAFAAKGQTGHIHIDVTVGGDVWHEAAVILVDDPTINTGVLSIPAGHIGWYRGKVRRIRIRATTGLEAYGFHGWG